MQEANKSTAQEEMENKLKEAIYSLSNRSDCLTSIMKPKLIACDEKERTATMEFPVQGWQSNPRGTMHGGLIASAFDEALGILAFCLDGGSQIATINISINYLKAIPLHGSILVSGKVTSKGKRIISVTGECRLKSSGLLTNTAQMIFSVL